MRRAYISIFIVSSAFYIVRIFLRAPFVRVQFCCPSIVDIEDMDFNPFPDIFALHARLSPCVTDEVQQSNQTACFRRLSPLFFCPLDQGKRQG